MFKKEGIWTTISAIIGILLMALVAFGVITSSEKELLQAAWQQVNDAIGVGGTAAILAAALYFIQQIILVFVKDPKKDK